MNKRYWTDPIAQVEPLRWVYWEKDTSNWIYAIGAVTRSEIGWACEHRAYDVFVRVRDTPWFRTAEEAKA